jgi:hypothetical protein
MGQSGFESYKICNLVPYLIEVCQRDVLYVLTPDEPVVNQRQHLPHLI